MKNNFNFATIQTDPYLCYVSDSIPPKQKLILPLKTRLRISIFTFIFDSIRRPDYSLNRRLLTFLDRKAPSSATPDRHGVSTHDLTLDPSRNLRIRLFVPPLSAPSPLPVFVYYHGGGFVYLSAASSVYDSLCRRLARRLGAVVASVDYRLAPEHKFPAQYDDAFDALRFLDDDSRRKALAHWPENADIGRCFIAGDSAGGNIAHHTAVRASEEPLSQLRVLGTVAVQPFFGGEELSESEIRLKGDPVVSNDRTIWMWKAFLPDGLGPDHWAKNVSGPNAKDLSGLDLPATMVAVGGFDPLQDGQRKYAEWLKKSGKEVMLIEYPNGCHGFNVFPESSALIDDIKAFMDDQMAKIH